MESSDKAVAIVMGCLFCFLAIGATVTTVKDVFVASELANAGLQQCVVKVNDKDTLVWKKECDK